MTTPAIKAGGKPVATKQDDSKTCNIVTYVDYQCPYCQPVRGDQRRADQRPRRERQSHDRDPPDRDSRQQLRRERILDPRRERRRLRRQLRPDSFFDVNAALFANQPAERRHRLTDSKILVDLKGAGAANNSDHRMCHSRKIRQLGGCSHPARTTGRPQVHATPAKFSGTPTVFVNGVAVPRPAHRPERVCRRS